ncbi:MAG: hypothetical protein HFJ27_03560 [Clostridia bacterium]|nr:hypothetical protein [Clostridia bacterium]
MGAFDRFWKKDNLLRKTIVIDNSLYEKLNEMAQNCYHTSTNQLINGCIEELIKTKQINIYAKPEGELSIKHSLLIRETLFNELEKMRDSYNISIYKLVNIAIKNALEETEK